MDQKKIKKDAIPFCFKKIGRAINSKYFAYNTGTKDLKIESVVVCDQGGMVFEKAESRDWCCLGISGKKVFDEMLGNGRLIEIEFSEN